MSWADEQPKTPDLAEFELQVYVVENMFHRLDDEDRAPAGKQLAEMLERLVGDEFLVAELTAQIMKAREEARETQRLREMAKSLDI